jgi:RND superfamily putative drug exporter
MKNFARRQYLGGQGRMLRMEVVITAPPMSNEGMARMSDVRRQIEQSLTRQGLSGTVHIAGATAQIAAIRDITQNDFRRVAVLVLVVVFLIVFALLRDLWLTLFMIGGICLSYTATLGICVWTFRAWGYAGLDWKVQIFLFVVMAAVGVDYSIFLAARLVQEARLAPPREAVRRAVITTGPVISSCGLIMAATLGSLMVGRIDLLRQLGFALGMGMLVDTFIVRPLLLPSFAALTGRTGKSRRLGG